LKDIAMTTPLRIAMIGAGHVGATAAYALMLRGLFSEIVLIDANGALADAEAADLTDADALARGARIWAGDYGDAASAQIAVITAGAATHGSQSRLSVAADSAVIVGACVDALMAAGFNGVIVVAANPVDLMSLLALRRSGLPPGRVIGTGTLLDSMRLRQVLSAHLGVAAGSIDGFVVGEHGDSEAAAFSTARVGGVALDGLTEGAPLDLSALATTVRTGAYRVVTGKGYTSFGIATAIVRIVEAVIRDEHAVLPVSTLLTGQYGIEGIYLSLPCVIGAGGVERVLEPDLDAGELSALAASAQVLREGAAALPRSSI
jgi:L-lactate dehydrogenase